MSFVLEALKKQEAGADPDAAVSLARSAAGHRRHRLWMGLFAVAMVVNAALLLWMYAQPEDPATGVGDNLVTGPVTARAAPAVAEQRLREPSTPPAGSRQEPRTSSAAEPGEAPAQTDPPPRIASPARAPAQAPATTTAPARTQTAAPERTGPIRIALDDLPPDARSRFPGIAFSTHVYAEDPELRAVIANGRRLTEGERIRGLEIVQITATGIVLAFENYRVEVPIVTDWDAL